MSRQLALIQVTFSEGIQEGRVQDIDYTMTMLKWQSPQLNSVLYMENYDHTRVDGALVKRPGWALLRPLEIEKDQDYYGLNPTNRWATDYTYTDPEDHIGFDLDRFSASTAFVRTAGDGLLHSSPMDGAGLAGVMSFPYARPISQEVILCFVRDEENLVRKSGTIPTEVTRTVSYSTDQPFTATPAGTRVNTEEQQRWKDPFINNPVETAPPTRLADTLWSETPGGTNGNVNAPQPHTYPGWKVYGTLADADRHGGLVIFSTVIRGTDEMQTGRTNTNYADFYPNQLYPVYVWGLWDITNKRQDDNLFWNTAKEPTASGTLILDQLNENYTADNAYSVFKVRQPSMSVQRDSIVSFASYVYDDCFVDGILEPASLGKHGGLMNDTPVGDVEIAIVEQKTRVYDTTGTDTMDTWPDLRRYEYQGQPYLPEVNRWIESLETLRLDIDEPTPNDVASRWYIKGPGMTQLHNYRYIGQNGSNPSWARQLVQVSVGLNIVPMDVIGFVGGNWKPLGRVKPLMPQEGSAEYKDYESKPESYLWGRMHDNDQRGEGEEYRLDHNAFWILPVRLPNYIEDGLPRPWIKGERIPLVVTLKVNGIEIFGGSHLYEVQRDVFDADASRYAEYNDRTANESFNQTNLNENSAQGKYWHWRSRAWYDTWLASPMRIGSQQILTPLVWGYQNWTNETDISWTDLLIGYNMDGPVYDLKKYRSVQEPLAYAWEPFNPTLAASTPYTPATDQYPWGNKNIVPDKYRAKHDELNVIFLFCKIKKDSVDKLLDLGLEEIRVYSAAPDPERSLLRSQGLLSFEEIATPGLYAYPITENIDDLSNYRLVQSYVLDGKTENLYGPNDGESWRELYSGERLGRRNSWWQMGTHLISVAQDDTKAPVAKVTPDFIMYDRPQTTANTPLILDSSGTYWAGKAASLVTVIKGRVFIGGCIDEYGKEEQGVIRYSDVQGGTISKDVFSKENLIYLGANPHTALVEYREQLWAFSEHDIYRMALDNIGDITTWEILERIEGQGTFSPKTVIVTPYGVCWANKSGVWLSDGRMPQRLTDSIPALYESMSTGQPYPYDSALNLGEIPTWPRHINPYLEVAYDPFEDELIVSTPFKQDEFFDGGGVEQAVYDVFDLVYSFSRQSWRTERIQSKVFDFGLSELNINGLDEF